MGVDDPSISIEAINEGMAAPATSEMPAARAAPGTRPPHLPATIRAGRAISVVFFVSIAARVLTLGSQALIAAIFGTSREMDAYTLALIVPATIAGILTTAVGAAFIPVFIDYRENRSEAESMRLLWAATTLGLLGLLVVTALLIVAAPGLITIFGHRLDAPTQALAVILLRFLMPILLLQGAITLLSAVLNAYGRFAVTSLLPAANACCIILFLIFARSLGVYALGWGTLVGYLVNLLLLLGFYFRVGLRFRLVFEWRTPGMRRLVALSSPALVGALLVNANILVDQFMAALLPPGSLASLSYAVRLVDTPAQFFYTALSSALLPVFSLQVARQDFTLLRTTYRQVVMGIAIILLPLGALLSVLARPVVEVLFQRGHFNPLSTQIVAGAMMLLAPSIFLFTCGFVNGRICNALQDNWTLRNVSALSIVLNAVLDYLCMQVWGVAGIAFATTLTYIITCLVMLVIINRKLPGLNLPQLGLSLGKTVLAAALLWLGCALLQQVPFIAAIPTLLRLGVVSSIGLVGYLVVLWGLRLQELAMLWGILRARFPGRG